MHLDYVPLLAVQREIYEIPRGMDRFRAYIDTLRGTDGRDVDLAPLVIANPMAREHVNAALDVLLAMDADGIGQAVARRLSARLAESPGAYRAALVVADDLGGWTNRWHWEHELRFGPERLRDRRPGAVRDGQWVSAVLWASEEHDATSIASALAAAVLRAAYVREHGAARTLRHKLAQEGEVLALAGADGPLLEPEELAYTHDVIEPHLDDPYTRTAIECLFGDEAARSLGFTPRGLSSWAGIALALDDARTRLASG